MREDFKYFARLLRVARKDQKVQNRAILELNRLDPVLFSAVVDAINPPYRAKPLAVEIINTTPMVPEQRKSVIMAFLRGAQWRKELRTAYPFFPGTKYHFWSFG